MRKLATLLVLVAASCATIPPSGPRTVSAPVPAGDAYTTVLRELTAMGYRILSGDRDGGFIRAEKEVPCTFSWCHRYDMQDVTVVPDSAGGVTVQVTPSTEMLPMDKKRRPDDLSKSAVADADRILARFGAQGARTASH